MGPRSNPDVRIEHEDGATRGAFHVYVDGKRLGELVYQRKAPDLVDIDHTEVDPSLRGQGIARKLLDAAVEWARDTRTQIKATCPYARGQFLRDESIRDVLAR